MVTLDALVVITALTAIHRDFGASLSTLQWTVNAYTLAFAAGITTAAALGDRFGRRRIFIAGLLLFSAASAACALSPSVETLIGARVLQGAAAAMVMPISLTILTAAFPPERRGAALRDCPAEQPVDIPSGLHRIPDSPIQRHRRGPG